MRVNEKSQEVTEKPDALRGSGRGLCPQKGKRLRGQIAAKGGGPCGHHTQGRALQGRRASHRSWPVSCWVHRGGDYSQKKS